MTSPQAQTPLPLARAKRRANKRGVALVMVLAAVTILTVILVEFQDESSADVSSALTDRDALKAEYIARSGINLSRLLIASEPTIRKSLSFFFYMMKTTPPQIPVWEFTDRVLGAFNDGEGAREFTALAGVDLSKGRNLGLEGGRFELVIVDEDSKLNINLAARGDAFSQTRQQTELNGLLMGDQHNVMFEQRDRDGQYSDRYTICSAIIDWVDPDETLWPCDPRISGASSSTGAEDSFYSMIEPPYRRKNTAFDSLEELHLVRGIGEDFWATFVDPEPGNPKKRTLTVWGQGAINVNTANPQTIHAVVCGAAVRPTPICDDPAKAQTFLMFFGLIRGMTAGAPLFGSGNDFVKTMQGGGLFGPMLAVMGVPAVQFTSPAEAAKLLSTESKVFSIYSDGVVKGFRRETRVRIHAVVDFRGAPPPGVGMGYGLNPMGSSSAGAGQFGTVPPMPTATGTSGQFAGSTPGANPNGIMGAIVPNPAGTVIYYRIE